MEFLIIYYKIIEQRVLKHLKNSDIKQRINASSGLWLGCLMGFTSALTILKEDGSYSEICLLTGLTGFGLLLSCLCLYTRLILGKTAIKDFHAIYFLPAIVTSLLYLFIANKGLFLSVICGLIVGSLGTWGVLQLMSFFPGCFTIGEATTVAHGGILFLLSTVTNLPLRYHLPPIHSNDISTVILQIGILYVLSLCILCKYISMLHTAKYFYTTAFGILFFIAIPLLYILLDQGPVTWILTYIFSKRQRIILILYWALCLLISTFTIIFQVLSASHASTATRKIFHICAVLVYIPGLLYEPTLLYLASGLLMALFLFLELIRFLKIEPLGQLLQQGFNAFVDEKDTLISLTPLYLLSGLSFPLWMPANNFSLLVLLSGILTVGIGDTVASSIGSKWGKHKWPGLTKTVEGTIACICSQLIIICIFACMGHVDSQWLLLRTILSVIIVSLVEAQTDQIDNLALPLLMYVCLII